MLTQLKRPLATVTFSSSPLTSDNQLWILEYIYNIRLHEKSWLSTHTGHLRKRRPCTCHVQSSWEPTPMDQVHALQSCSKKLSWFLHLPAGTTVPVCSWTAHPQGGTACPAPSAAQQGAVPAVCHSSPALGLLCICLPAPVLPRDAPASTQSWPFQAHVSKSFAQPYHVFILCKKITRNPLKKKKKPRKKPFLWLQEEPSVSRSTRHVNSRLHTPCLFFISNKEAVLRDEGGWAQTFYSPTSDLPVSLTYPEPPEGNSEIPTKGVRWILKAMFVPITDILLFLPPLLPSSSLFSSITLQCIVFLQNHAPRCVCVYAELWLSEVFSYSTPCTHPIFCTVTTCPDREACMASCCGVPGTRLGTVRNNDF